MKNDTQIIIHIVVLQSTSVVNMKEQVKSAIATSDIGRTDQQIEAVNQVIQQVIERHPESKSYNPQTII